MNQPVKKTEPTKAVQAQPAETDKHPELHKKADAKVSPKISPISRFLEASCDCV